MLASNSLWLPLDNSGSFPNQSIIKGQSIIPFWLIVFFKNDERFFILVCNHFKSFKFMKLYSYINVFDTPITKTEIYWIDTFCNYSKLYQKPKLNYKIMNLLRGENTRITFSNWHIIQRNVTLAYKWHINIINYLRNRPPPSMMILNYKYNQKLLIYR